MYLATAEVAKLIVKTVRPTKRKDRIYAEHLEYLIFSNLVANGSYIMMRHDIFPEPSEEMSDVMPSMSTSHELWIDSSSSEA